MRSNRMRRVDELLRRELGTQFERLIAPELDALVTITAVTTSPDLRQATVSVSVMGSEAAQTAALRLLQKRRTLLQRELAQHVKLKFTPVLSFHLDETLARADRVLALMDELGLDEAAAADPDAAASRPDDAPGETVDEHERDH